jgi:hypothetical protein
MQNLQLRSDAAVDASASVSYSCACGQARLQQTIEHGGRLGFRPAPAAVFYITPSPNALARRAAIAAVGGVQGWPRVSERPAEFPRPDDSTPLIKSSFIDFLVTSRKSTAEDGGQDRPEPPLFRLNLFEGFCETNQQAPD